MEISDDPTNLQLQSETTEPCSISEMSRPDTQMSYTESSTSQSPGCGGGPSHKLRRFHVPRVKHGHAYFRSMESRYYLEDFESEIDPEGEKKVDKNGHLKDNREYKVRCFSLPRDPEKLFVLARDVSRTLQFRDTYVLYLKNPNLVRIMATPEDRLFMKQHNILPAVLKNRSVSIATARSMFREFGHKCIRKGRINIDDYWVSNPKDIIRIDPPLPPRRELSIEEKSPVSDSNNNLHFDDHSSSDKKPFCLQFSFSSTVPLFSRKKSGELNSIQKEKSKITAILSINDPKMLRTVASSLTFNKFLLESRRKFYIDTQTNCKQYPVKVIKPPHSLPITSFKPPEKDTFPPTNQDIVQNCTFNPLRAARLFQDKILNDPPPPNEAFPIAIMPSQYES